MGAGPTIIKAITIVIITIILLALTPVIVSQVQSLVYKGTSGPTGDKWNFTGFSGALSMLGLMPFVWVAGVLLAAVVGMLALYRGGGKGD